jgi:excisionase family DNA binding protein
MGAFLIVY